MINPSTARELSSYESVVKRILDKIISPLIQKAALKGESEVSTSFSKKLQHFVEGCKKTLIDLGYHVEIFENGSEPMLYISWKEKAKNK